MPFISQFVYQLKTPLLLSAIWISAFSIWFGLSDYLAIAINNIEIAITMLFGSMVAGGTPLGGGAVAFPVMTKLLGYSPEFAKQFSLAIQTVGMGTASVFILTKKIPIYKNRLLACIIASSLGVLCGLTLFQGVFSLGALKILFSGFMVFVFITLLKLEFSRGKKNHNHRLNSHFMPLFAFIGGSLSGLIGSGVDMIFFALLVMAYRVNIKIAIATSVLIMAATSLVASLINVVINQGFEQQLQHLLVTAIPVVSIGAPLGALICYLIPPRILFYILSCLISIEVLSTVYLFITI